MREQIREVVFTLGNKSYSVRAALSEPEFKELQDFCADLFNSIKVTRDQERKLLLGWLMTAYQLQQGGKRLRVLCESFTTEDKNNQQSQ